MTAYYINGSYATASQAMDCVEASADMMGYDRENWIDAWRNREVSEESREFLNEISGYVLEIQVDY